MQCVSHTLTIKASLLAGQRASMLTCHSVVLGVRNNYNPIHAKVTVPALFL